MSARSRYRTALRAAGWCLFGVPCAFVAWLGLLGFAVGNTTGGLKMGCMVALFAFLSSLITAQAAYRAGRLSKGLDG